MNIFLLDSDVDRCAQYHCDKHVVKMVLESAQILCTALWTMGVFNESNTRRTPQRDGQSDIYLYTHMGGLETRVYAPTHPHHPCCVWATDLRNWVYLRRLAQALGKEYTHRYGKTHKSIGVINGLPIPEMTVGNPRSWVIAMPDEIKADVAITSFRDSAIELYREYYKYKLGVIKMTWKKRDIPSWLDYNKHYMLAA